MSIFEKASKAKLRFSTSRGQLSTEDLWDLSLESLDQIAINVDKQIETSGTKSFIGKRSTKNAELELALELLKHIISVKLAEKDAKAKRAEKSAKVAELKALIAEKSVEELRGKSTQELLAELDAIEKEE
jgi:hypothetical protein